MPKKQNRKNSVSEDTPAADMVASTTNNISPTALEKTPSSPSNSRKANEVEAQLMKQLTNVMLQSPRNLSDLTTGTSKPVKKNKQDYAFWKTQPVPDLDEKISENKPVELDLPVSEIRNHSYSLPSGFEWCNLDLNNADQLDELFVLLNENYVEDDDHLFRFAYAREFLKWTMQPPGWRPDWHVSVRVTKNKKLVGFIAGMPTDIKVHGLLKKMVEINFLCVHKRLRDKRMAPVLIREITRRVNLHEIFQAVYTSGIILPSPVSTCRYWHRPLNPRKLIDVGFSHLSRTMTLARAMKLYRLPDSTSLSGFRELQEKDLPQARNLLHEYFTRFKLHPVFSEAEFRHWFLPRDDIVYSFVVEDKDGEVTDMCSFYSLPSSVMQNPKYSTLRAVYSFYNFTTKTSWTVLMKEAITKAKQLGYDVFNALNLMDNPRFLEELKFGIGDGNLYYYLYNWMCPALEPEDVAIVLQ